MILSIFTLISALSISATAAYFSIIGLATMFPGAQGAIIIMGSVLEVGKIVAAIWLHSNWRSLSIIIKGYLSFAVLTLMLITSMGIFGFLSKSYIVHEAEANKEIAQAAQVESQIFREQNLIKKYEESIKETKNNKAETTKTKVSFIQIEEGRIEKINNISKESISTEIQNIDRWQERISALDEDINLIKSKSGLFSNSKKKLEEERVKQKDEREEISKRISLAEENIASIQQDKQKTINEIQKKIEDFQNAVIDSSNNKSNNENLLSLINDSQSKIESLEIKKFDINKRVSELEVEVGPVKYIVELFDDFGKKDLGLDSAVRLVIIALIFVFDPLAVLLVVVSVASFKKTKIKKEITIKEEVVPESIIHEINELKKVINKPNQQRLGKNSILNWSQDK